MKRSLITSALAVLALAVGTVGAFPATAVASGSVEAHVLATFAPGAGGAFAESMAADGHGRLIVSVTRWGVEQADGSWTANIGQLYRLGLDGTTVPYGPSINLGGCSLLTGVTVDADRVFVAVGTFDQSCGASSPASGVLRVTGSAATRLLTMPAGTMANGLVVVHDRFYVTDSASGSVWAGPADRTTAPTTPWFSSTKLTPTEAITLGADGIAYRDGRLYVTGYARGYVLSVRIDHNGRAADPRVVAHDARLVHADGIAFDARGSLWVAVNAVEGVADSPGALVVVVAGQVRSVATPVGSLDYPTQPVPLGDALLVANGSYANGTPSVVRFTRMG